MAKVGNITYVGNRTNVANTINVQNVSAPTVKTAEKVMDVNPAASLTTHNPALSMPYLKYYTSLLEEYVYMRNSGGTENSEWQYSPFIACTPYKSMNEMPTMLVYKSSKASIISDKRKEIEISDDRKYSILQGSNPVPSSNDIIITYKSPRSRNRFIKNIDKDATADHRRFTRSLVMNLLYSFTQDGVIGATSKPSSQIVSYLLPALAWFGDGDPEELQYLLPGYLMSSVKTQKDRWDVFDDMKNTKNADGSSEMLMHEPKKYDFEKPPRVPAVSMEEAAYRNMAIGFCHVMGYSYAMINYATDTGPLTFDSAKHYHTTMHSWLVDEYPASPDTAVKKYASLMASFVSNTQTGLSRAIIPLAIAGLDVGKDDTTKKKGKDIRRKFTQMGNAYDEIDDVFRQIAKWWYITDEGHQKSYAKQLKNALDILTIDPTRSDFPLAYVRVFVNNPNFITDSTKSGVKAYLLNNSNKMTIAPWGMSGQDFNHLYYQHRAYKISGEIPIWKKDKGNMVESSVTVDVQRLQYEKTTTTGVIFKLYVSPWWTTVAFKGNEFRAPYALVAGRDEVLTFLDQISKVGKEGVLTRLTTGVRRGITKYQEEYVDTKKAPYIFWAIAMGETGWIPSSRVIPSEAGVSDRRLVINQASVTIKFGFGYNYNEANKGANSSDPASRYKYIKETAVYIAKDMAASLNAESSGNRIMSARVSELLEDLTLNIDSITPETADNSYLVIVGEIVGMVAYTLHQLFEIYSKHGESISGITSRNKIISKILLVVSIQLIAAARGNVKGLELIRKLKSNSGTTKKLHKFSISAINSIGSFNNHIRDIVKDIITRSNNPIEIEREYLQQVSGSYGVHIQNLYRFIKHIRAIQSRAAGVTEYSSSRYNYDSQYLDDINILHVVGEIIESNPNMIDQLEENRISRVEKDKITKNHIFVPPDATAIRLVSKAVTNTSAAYVAPDIPVDRKHIPDSVEEYTYTDVINDCNRGILSIMSLAKSIIGGGSFRYKNLKIRNFEDPHTNTATTITKYQVGLASSTIPIYMDGHTDPLIQNFGGTNPTIELSLITNDVFLIDDITSASQELSMTFRTTSELNNVSPLASSFGVLDPTIQKNSIIYNTTRANLQRRISRLAKGDTSYMAEGKVDTPLLITNNVANMAGIYGCVLNRISVATIAGFPNTYQIDMSFTGVDINQQYRETPRKVGIGYDALILATDLCRHSFASHILNNAGQSELIQVNNIQSAILRMLSQLIVANFLVDLMSNDSDLKSGDMDIESIGHRATLRIDGWVRIAAFAIARYASNVMYPIMRALNKVEALNHSQSYQEIIKTETQKLVKRFRDTMSSTDRFIVHRYSISSDHILEAFTKTGGNPEKANKQSSSEKSSSALTEFTKEYIKRSGTPADMSILAYTAEADSPSKNNIVYALYDTRTKRDVNLNDILYGSSLEMAYTYKEEKDKTDDKGKRKTIGTPWARDETIYKTNLTLLPFHKISQQRLTSLTNRKVDKMGDIKDALVNLDILGLSWLDLTTYVLMDMQKLMAPGELKEIKPISTAVLVLGGITAHNVQAFKSKKALDMNADAIKGAQEVFGIFDLGNDENIPIIADFTHAFMILLVREMHKNFTLPTIVDYISSPKSIATPPATVKLLAGKLTGDERNAFVSVVQNIYNRDLSPPRLRKFGVSKENLPPIADRKIRVGNNPGGKFTYVDLNKLYVVDSARNTTWVQAVNAGLTAHLLGNWAYNCIMNMYMQKTANFTSKLITSNTPGKGETLSRASFTEILSVFKVVNIIVNTREVQSQNSSAATVPIMNETIMNVPSVHYGRYPMFGELLMAPDSIGIYKDIRTKANDYVVFTDGEINTESSNIDLGILRNPNTVSRKLAALTAYRMMDAIMKYIILPGINVIIDTDQTGSIFASTSEIVQNTLLGILSSVKSRTPISKGIHDPYSIIANGNQRSIIHPLTLQLMMVKRPTNRGEFYDEYSAYPDLPLPVLSNSQRSSESGVFQRLHLFTTPDFFILRDNSYLKMITDTLRDRTTQAQALIKAEEANDTFGSQTTAKANVLLIQQLAEQTSESMSNRALDIESQFDAIRSEATGGATDIEGIARFMLGVGPKTVINKKSKAYKKAEIALEVDKELKKASSGRTERICNTIGLLQSAKGGGGTDADAARALDNDLRITHKLKGLAMTTRDLEDLSSTSSLLENALQRVTNPNSSGNLSTRELSVIRSLTNPSGGAYNVKSMDMLNDKLNVYEANCRRHNHMSTFAMAFPTFKFYIIEEDANEFLFFNDFYDYSAIKSIRINKTRKHASDTAYIELSNMYGRLTNIISGKRRNTENPFHVRPSDEENVTSMFLRTGARIQIRLGYNGWLSQETIAFSGRIQELQGTNDIIIVAQSHGVELTRDIGTGSGKDFGGFLGRIQAKGKQAGFSQTSSALGLVATLLDEAHSPLRGMGTTSPFLGISRLRNVSRQTIAGLHTVDTPTFGFAGQLLRLAGTKAVKKVTGFDFKLVDNRLTNVNLVGEPSMSWFRTLFGKSRWLIHNETIWDALQDYNLQLGNKICTVRNMDEDNTLVIDSDDGVYQRSLENYHEVAKLFPIISVLENAEKNSVYGITYIAALLQQETKAYPDQERYRIVHEIVRDMMFKGMKGIMALSIDPQVILQNTNSIRVMVEEIVNELDNTADKEQENYAPINTYIAFAKEYESASQQVIDELKTSLADSIGMGTGEGAITLIDKPEDTDKTKGIFYHDAFDKAGVGSGEANQKMRIKLYTAVSNMEGIAKYLKHKISATVRSMRAVCDIHIKTSRKDIIKNNIKTVNGYNRVDMSFIDEDVIGSITGMIGLADIGTLLGFGRAITIDGIDKPSARINLFVSVSQTIQYDRINTYSTFQKNAAIRGAIIIDNPRITANSILANLIRDYYDGELIMMMDPTIEPYDFIFMHDDVNDMWGIIQVKEVTHSFSRETGAVTIVKPDMYVRNNIDNTRQMFSTWSSQVIGKATLASTQLIVMILTWGMGKFLLRGGAGVVTGLSSKADDLIGGREGRRVMSQAMREVSKNKTLSTGTRNTLNKVVSPSILKRSGLTRQAYYKQMLTSWVDKADDTIAGNAIRKAQASVDDWITKPANINKKFGDFVQTFNQNLKMQAKEMSEDMINNWSATMMAGIKSGVNSTTPSIKTMSAITLGKFTRQFINRQTPGPAVGLYSFFRGLANPFSGRSFKAVVAGGLMSKIGRVFIPDMTTFTAHIGEYYNMRPITISGLVHKGEPMVANLDGMRRKDFGTFGGWLYYKAGQMFNPLHELAGNIEDVLYSTQDSFSKGAFKDIFN